ncbi:hypothetical protein [Microvirga massiliensis]|uniref:hypothetical protein n=1 Tax=Microvirga massiliensis TaxID=1033741 RepID=UPI00062BC219|nr:hypothetical protein [Microvirga massiliensis]
MNKLVRTALGIGLLWQMGTPSAAADLGTWRELTADEEAVRIAGIPPASIDPSVIEGDFNGDGILDRAMIAIRTTDQVRGLIAVIDSHIHVIAGDPGAVGDRDGLGIAPPGRWDPVCGNALREFHECDGRQPTTIDLTTSGILLIGEGETVLYFWDKKIPGFRNAVMID